MLDSALTLLAISIPELTTLYWISLIVGGGLLLISTFAGGDADADVGLDADVDVDIDIDADVDAGHAHAGALASWFSMQFIVFFMAMFGLVGVAMTYLSDGSSGVVLLFSLAGGLLVGQGVHQVLRKLRRNSGNSTTKPLDYVNKLARVNIAVSHDRKGEIALRVGRSDRYVPAMAKHEHDTFQPDQQVGVVAYRDGVAEVVSRKEFEFLGESSRKEQAQGSPS